MYDKILLEPIQDMSLDSWRTNINTREGNQYFLGFYEGTEFRILLKFDLSILPLGSEIVEANLKLYCNRNSNKWQEKYYNAHLITQEWFVRNTTWETQPAYDSKKRIRTGVKSNKFDFITWDITAFAQTWQDSQDLNFGVMLIAERENLQGDLLGFSRFSRSGEWRPRLELVLQVPQSEENTPEPSPAPSPKPDLSSNPNPDMFSNPNQDLSTILNPNPRPSPKVAILTPQFFEWTGDRCLFGGGERYLIDFVNLLQRMGYQTDVFQPSIGLWEKTYDGVKIFGLGNVTFDMDFFTVANRLFYERAAGYDHHIYFNLTVAYPKIFPGSICINHGIWWDSNERPWWRTEKWYERLFNGLKKVNTFVSVDTNTINWLNAVKPDLEVKKIYIPNYVDLDCVNNTIVSKKSENLTILYPRRLYHSRGWLVCRDLATELISEYKNMRFMFVGRGSQNDEERLMLLCQDNPRIEYKWYDMKDIYQAYSEADIVLIPSTSSEGTSLSLIEAMAFGKPIIAGLVGGLTDLIIPGYNGLLIEITKENLKKAIVTLIENPDLRELYGRNAKEVAQCFSKKIWEERWRKVIESCFSGVNYQ